LFSRSAFPPVESRIAKWFDRHISQEVCPWNAKLSRDATDMACAPHPELATPDFAVFARMDDVEFKHRFGDTPLVRARRAGIEHNITTVLRSARTAGDVCWRARIRRSRASGRR